MLAQGSGAGHRQSWQLWGRQGETRCDVVFFWQIFMFDLQFYIDVFIDQVEEVDQLYSTRQVFVLVWWDPKFCWMILVPDDDPVFILNHGPDLWCYLHLSTRQVNIPLLLETWLQFSGVGGEGEAATWTWGTSWKQRFHTVISETEIKLSSLILKVQRWGASGRSWRRSTWGLP